jgi:putative inorganic carbon (HCO3(-)) transporter
MPKKMFKLLTILDHLHWLWLGLAAPFLLFPTPLRSLAMLVVPGLWLLHGVVTRRELLPVTPLNLPVLLLAFMVLVSTWATYDLSVSLPKISGMVLGLGAYFAVVRESSVPSRWRWSLLAFLGLGLGVAALSFLGTQWTESKFLLFNPLTSRFPQLVAGLQGAEEGFHPNEVAGALLWVLPSMFTLSLSLQSSPQRRVLLPIQRTKAVQSDPEQEKDRFAKKISAWTLRLVLWLSTLFVFIVFILTQSRGSYLALLVTGLVILFVLLPSRGRVVLLVVLLFGGVILGLVFLRARSIGLGQGIPDYALIAWRSFLANNTFGLRIEIWSRALFALQDFSFTGMGMNTFRYVVHKIYPLFSVSKDIGHAHNEFLQAGLDLGIPGLIAFVALYIGAFWMLAAVWKDVETFNVRRLTVFGLGGGLFAHLLYGLTDAIALGAKPGLLFWMLLGVIAGLYEQMIASPKRSS